MRVLNLCRIGYLRLFRHDILHDRSGIAAIELALALPLLLIFLIGSVEIARYAIIQQKLDKVSYTMGDLATQTQNPTTAQLDQYAAAAQQIMTPFSFDGTIIFSTIASYGDGATSPCGTTADKKINCITSQHIVPNNGVTSGFGTPGQTASLPSGYSIAPGENVVVSEVKYNYRTLFPVTKTVMRSMKFMTVGNVENKSSQTKTSTTSAVSEEVIYKTSILKPRQQTTIASGEVDTRSDCERLGGCTPPTCSEDKKISWQESYYSDGTPNYTNALCVAKTCVADNYNCAVCIGQQTLNREANVCVDPVCGEGFILDNNTKNCIPKNCAQHNYNCPQPPICTQAQKLVNNICVDKTCAEDNYGCAQCIGDQILNRLLNRCEDPVCAAGMKLDNATKRCVPMTCVEDNYNCCTPIGEQTINPVTKSCVDPVCVAPQILNQTTKFCEMTCPAGLVFQNGICTVPGKSLDPNSPPNIRPTSGLWVNVEIPVYYASIGNINNAREKLPTLARVCQDSCASKGLVSGVSPEGMSCTTGEISAKYSYKIGLYNHTVRNDRGTYTGTFLYKHGIWDDARLQNTTGSTFIEAKERYEGRNGSMLYYGAGAYCYSNGGVKDSDKTDLVDACWCKPQ